MRDHAVFIERAIEIYKADLPKEVSPELLIAKYEPEKPICVGVIVGSLKNVVPYTIIAPYINTDLQSDMEYCNNRDWYHDMVHLCGGMTNTLDEAAAVCYRICDYCKNFDFRVIRTKSIDEMVCFSATDDVCPFGVYMRLVYDYQFILRNNNAKHLALQLRADKGFRDLSAYAVKLNVRRVLDIFIQLVDALVARSDLRDQIAHFGKFDEGAEFLLHSPGCLDYLNTFRSKCKNSMSNKKFEILEDVGSTTDSTCGAIEAYRAFTMVKSARTTQRPMKIKGYSYQDVVEHIMSIGFVGCNYVHVYNENRGSKCDPRELESEIKFIDGPCVICLYDQNVALSFTNRGVWDCNLLVADSKVLIIDVKSQHFVVRDSRYDQRTKFGPYVHTNLHVSVKPLRKRLVCLSEVLIAAGIRLTRKVARGTTLFHVTDDLPYGFNVDEANNVITIHDPTLYHGLVTLGNNYPSRYRQHIVHALVFPDDDLDGKKEDAVRVRRSFSFRDLPLEPTQYDFLLRTMIEYIFKHKFFQRGTKPMILTTGRVAITTHAYFDSRMGANLVIYHKVLQQLAPCAINKVMNHLFFADLPVEYLRVTSLPMHSFFISHPNGTKKWSLSETVTDIKIIGRAMNMMLVRYEDNIFNHYTYGLVGFSTNRTTGSIADLGIYYVDSNDLPHRDGFIRFIFDYYPDVVSHDVATWDDRSLTRIGKYINDYDVFLSSIRPSLSRTYVPEQFEALPRLRVANLHHCKRCKTHSLVNFDCECLSSRVSLD